MSPCFSLQTLDGFVFSFPQQTTSSIIWVSPPAAQDCKSPVADDTSDLLLLRKLGISSTVCCPSQSPTFPKAGSKHLGTTWRPLFGAMLCVWVVCGGGRILAGISCWEAVLEHQTQHSGSCGLRPPLWVNSSCSDRAEGAFVFPLNWLGMSLGSLKVFSDTGKIP